MALGRTWAELRSLSDAELIEAHDQLAGSTIVGTDYYLRELARREGERRERVMIRLTWAIFGFTAVNVLAVAVIALTG